MGVDQAPASDPAASGERRVVTVLFADISGFSALAEHLDPETLCTLVNACFDELVAVVERYGGTVDKFIGDSVMVLFGAPAAHEDDPDRACHTALEMMTAMRRFSARHGVDWGIHVGINTGVVVAGGVGARGRLAYTVMGDPVNVAARLLAGAERGQILVGAATKRLVGAGFEFIGGAPRKLRGKRQEVLAWLLRDPDEGAAPRALAAPVVGRGGELAAVRAAIEGAAHGTGGALIVVGEAGLGKSRLLVHARATSPPAVRWAVGRCLSHRTGVGYHLVRALVRALMPAGATLSEWLGGLLGGEADAVRPFVAHLLGEATTPEDAARTEDVPAEALRMRYLASLRALVGACARAGPLALVCEDLHWADPSSVELLEGLLPLVAAAPLLICASTRPEPTTPGWRLIAAMRGLGARATEVGLAPLAEADTRNLVELLLGGEADPRLTGFVLARAEGNPLFVEELVRALVEGGAAAEVPDSLHGLLLARMDRLPEPARLALRVAATLGRTFSAVTLAKVLALLGAGGREEALAQLEQAGIVQQARPPEPEYAFRHALFQEAAYASLLRSERARLHRAIGAALEQIHAGRLDELSPVLARHFYEAGDHERARAYLRVAGDRALAAFANREAEAHYRRALEKIGGLADQAGLLAGLGEALYRQGRYPETLDAWQHALELLTALGDHDRVATLYARAARVAWWNGHVPKSLSLCEDGLSVVRSRPPSPGRAMLLHEAARACFYNGKRAAARPLLRRALAMVRSTGPEVVEIEARTTQALLYRGERRFARARQELERAIALTTGAEEGGADLLFAAGRAFNNLAELLEDDFAALPEARAAFERSAALMRRRGSANEALYVGAQIAAVALTMGDLPAVEAALPGLRRLADERERAGLGALLLDRVEGLLLRCRGSLAAAAGRLDFCAARVRERGDLEALAKVHLSLAELRLDQGEPQAAEGVLREAVAIAEHGMVNSVVVRGLLAVVCCRTRRPAAGERLIAEARAHARGRLGPWDRRALALAEAALAAARRKPAAEVAALEQAAAVEAKISALWLQARTLLALAAALRGAGEAAAGRRRRAEALALFERLGVSPAAFVG